MPDYDGRCHCGAVGFTYSTDVPPAEWSVRACQCRFCRMHDSMTTSDPGGTLSFISDDPEALQHYRFALRTADFLVCRQCGVYVGAVIDLDGKRFGIANTRALVKTPADIAAVGAISYGDEDAAGRISRRAERWTPVA